MADEAIYRCINDACGRPAPRRVNYCPWCGTAQTRAGARAAAAAVPAGAAAAAAAASVAPPAAPTAPAASAIPAPPPSASDFGRTGKGVAQAGTPQPAAADPAAPQPAAAVPGAAPGAGQVPPPQEVPRPPLPPHPPQRRPIRLRWWLLVLAALWALWLVAKPSGRKIDRRIDAAIALAHECKGSEAQTELIALRKSSATPEQLQRLQTALNEEAAICTRRRLRAKAWNETSGAVESALAAASFDKAKTRLQAFIKRWGEDENTRALRTRIEDLRREDEAHRAHPLAAPPPAQQEGMME